MSSTPLPRQTVSLYAAMVAPTALLGTPFNVYLPPFITSGDVVGVGLVGLLFTICTLWDGVVDPLIGTAIDRLRLPGYHRRWIQLSAPPLLLFMGLLVVLGDQLSFPAILVILLLFYSSLSIMDVAHLAWGSALVNDRDESSRAFGAREWAGKWALLIGFAAPAVAQLLIPGLSLQGRIFAYASLALLFVPLALLLAQRLPLRPIVPQPGIGWRKEVSATLTFAPLMGLLGVQTLNAFAFGALTSTFVFYADGTLGLDDRSSVLLLLTFVGGAVFTPLWTWLARRWGKPRTMIAMALWLAALMSASLARTPEGLFQAASFSFLLGSGFVGLVFTYGMAADLVPMDSERCGRDRSGFIFAMINLVMKAGAALAIGASYAILDWIGFDATNAATYGDKLNLIFAGVPSLTWLFMAALLLWLQSRPELNRS